MELESCIAVWSSHGRLLVIKEVAERMSLKSGQTVNTNQFYEIVQQNMRYVSEALDKHQNPKPKTQ